MYRYPITIELLSETIFGSGESKNGIINTEVLIDENGFPYYLGKTFKGNLRDAAFIILKPYYESIGAEFDTIFYSIFGGHMVDKKEVTKEGKIKITDFYLHKSIVDLFDNNEKNKKEVIISSLADVRYSIKVNENDIAENKFLRTTRVLKKGLVFVGFIECEEELSVEEYKFLENASKALKNLGMRKSRGKGNVKVSLFDKEEKPINNYQESNMVNEEDFKYIFYELNLKESVKIGDSQAKYDYEESKLYITGSTIRGAILDRIANKYKKEDFEEFLKKLNFYDAYPVIEFKGKTYFSFPTPNIYRITKDRDKEDKKLYEKTDFSLVFDNDLNGYEDRKVKKLKRGAFSIYDDKEKKIYQFNIKKEFKFHHSRDKSKSNIFRYEAIAKDQKFYGVIDVSRINKELRKELYNNLKSNNIFYFGGSRTGGYGKTEMTEISSVKNFESLKGKLGYFKININSDLYLYFLSDAIIRDKNHQITQEFDLDYLNKKLDINLDDKGYKAIEEEIEPVIITGFNSTWQSRLPQVYGIEKGSVIRIPYTDEVREKSIESFIENQHGDRINDGLGRIIVNPNFMNPQSIEYIENEYSVNKNEYYKISRLPQENIEYIKKRIDKVIIEESIKSYITKNIEDIKDIKKISNSQINNVIIILDKCISKNGQEFDEFAKYIRKLKAITTNDARNIANDNLLNAKILKENNLNSILSFNKDMRKQILKDIGIDNENDVDKVFLTLIKEILYYSLKDVKTGEYSE